MWQVMANSCEQHRGQPQTDHKQRANKQKLFPNSRVLLSHSPKGSKRMSYWDIPRVTCITAQYSTRILLPSPSTYPDNIPRQHTQANTQRQLPRHGVKNVKGKGTENKVTSALARVSKEQLQICTFKYCISCTNVFFTVKAKVLFNPDQAADQNMRILAAAFVTIHWKRNSHAGSSWTKESPASFRIVQTNSCPCHTPTSTTPLRQDLALSQKVNIPGAFCMQEIQQQWQCKLYPQPGPEPLPWQSAAPTGVRDPLSYRQTWQL